ncbi:MAG: oligosaccharide flippase family protein [Chloroflexota bacterium]
MNRTNRRPDVLLLIGLLLLLAVFFWPVLLGGKTLLPADNLFAWEPWKTFAPELGVGVPHNGLLSDLILENYVWKRFIVQSIESRSIPLWNPNILAGVPFLAAGQHSAMYPLSLIFYILPLAQAYGVFTLLQLWLAGTFMYIYLRTIRVGRFGSIIAGITYAFSGFFVTSVVFTMIIAAAAWLPLLLTAIELIIRKAESGHHKAVNLIPGFLLGAFGLGMQCLAGHPELYYYNLLVMAFYSLARLITLWWKQRDAARVVHVAVWLFGMVLVGFSLGAVQLVPLFELVQHNFRVGSASYQQVVGWAYPWRRIIAFFVPDFFGNPTHHSYWDPLARAIIPATRDALGQSIDTIDWGIKNYVEGASYLGILPLALTLIAILKDRNRYTTFFAVLAVTSLLLVFGTPLYALIFWLPGVNQLHSPFRWIFPYTLCVAVMAGIGANAISKEWKERLHHKALPGTVGWIGLASLGAGLLLLLVLGLSLLMSDRVIPLAERVMLDLAKAPEAFADGRMFYVYQFKNLLVLAANLILAGIALLLSRTRLRWPGRLRLPNGLGFPGRLRGIAPWQMLLVSAIVLDLFAFGHGFNPAADPKLLDFTPPVIEFLQQDTDLYRVTTFIKENEKPFNANAFSFWDIQDIRGYDSIIPKQYADYMRAIEPQNELLHNRIAPINKRESLQSPLLDLLNVKYVITSREIRSPKYTLIYDDELRVYRNEDVLPRAFMVHDLDTASNSDELALALSTFDPRRTAILETGSEGGQVSEHDPLLAQLESSPEGQDFTTADIIDYTPNQVRVRVSAADTGLLILADSYFPGWKAYRQFSDGTEEEIPIYRADGNFRAVLLEPGTHTVRFIYTPMSFKIGLYVSFIATTALLLLLAYAAWSHYYRESSEDAVAQRVAKNTLTPTMLQLVNKAIDMAFAMLMLRILAPENAGRYYFAILIVSWLDIFTNFGLNTLVTREIGKDREKANRYLSNTTILRLCLSGIAAPLLFLFIVGWRSFSSLPSDTTWAIVLMAIGLIPSGIATGLSAVFNAYEKMEYPAAITTVTTLLRVSLSTLVLLAGLGFVGLAGVSIVVNVVTAGILFHLLVRHLFRPHLEVNWNFQKRILHTSYPLMINHLMATLFFKVDVMFLQAMQGDTIVGLYSTAYKYIDALNIVPASFTMAIFPLMSRYASTAKGSLLRAYKLSIKLLLIFALPTALLTTLTARYLIIILGGSEYLPHSMITLQILIWYMPFGFINSVTQYVLIALDQQRFLTRAFAIGLGFNVVANRIFIPIYGYQAAAVIAVVSELALLIPFYYGVRRHLAPLPWFELTWRPAASAALMGIVTLALRQPIGLILASVCGLTIYILALVLLGTFETDDMELARRALPLGKFRRKLLSLLPWR